MNKNIIIFTLEIEKTRKEIIECGGRITQQFTENVILVDLPESVSPSDLKSCSVDQPDKMDEVSALVSKAWLGIKGSKKDRAPEEKDGLSWDSPGFMSPNHDKKPSNSPSSGTNGENQRSTGTPTSLYMTGSIAVGVVIVSGTTGNLVFTNAENLKVIQEVQEGLNFLANEEPRAQITFVYDIHLINVSVAPGGTGSYESAEGPWRNAALQQMGFSPSRTGSIDYVNHLRNSKGTNWAYVAYFTKYPLHHFAYAGYERLVMHYLNDGWGVNNINKVFAHETCHIFGAADEYGSCNCGGSHGYLGIPNNNCQNCAGTQESCLMKGNTLQICQWSRAQIGWDESLFPQVFPPLSRGIFTIQQKSSNRFMDAHQSSSKDFSVVTRTAQNNNTQRWFLNPVGMLCTVQQKSNGRFLDAHESTTKDFAAVTRSAQNNDTQKWVFLNTPEDLSSYSIQQLRNGRFLDAWETSIKDFSVVTRTAQNNDTQKWLLSPLGENTYKVQHKINNRFLDAHSSSSNDYKVVTRTAQNNSTQEWIITPVGGVYTLQQQSSGRLLDAHEYAGKDFSVVTRQLQNNQTQLWVIKDQGDQIHTIQQLSNGRYVDAHQSSSNDYKVVTRTSQNNDTQRWEIKPI